LPDWDRQNLFAVDFLEILHHRLTVVGYVMMGQREADLLSPARPRFSENA
jgi:hypothetical protein